MSLRLADAELEDALQVLNCANLHFDDAVPVIEDARRFVDRALRTRFFSLRNHFMRLARNEMEEAREIMIVRPSD